MEETLLDKGLFSDYRFITLCLLDPSLLKKQKQFIRENFQYFQNLWKLTNQPSPILTRFQQF